MATTLSVKDVTIDSVFRMARSQLCVQAVGKGWLMFISPTEPKRLGDTGVVSLTPEEYGVDVLFQTELGLVGVQRKVFPGEFLASVHEGWINKEDAQMR